LPSHIARILVIEDDPLVREVLRLELTEAGYEVYAVADGRSGIVSAEEAAPDAVVLDLQLPGLDGEQVFYCLNAIYPASPIFLFTSTSISATAWTCRKLPGAS
jgi:DNA-binding response OmpR family regulator